MTREISNYEDIIDSRDVIERISDLELDEESLDEDEKDELAALRELAEEAEGYAPDWQYGEALIRDSYFEEYAQEMAEDCYEMPDQWPFYCIDWERAARELKMDYTCVDFGGKDYWIRS